MSPTQNQFQKFEAQREALTDQLQKSRACFAEIGMQAWATTCDALLAKLASARFKVIVLGEFKRGKSTFINALLGRDVLPAFATPCTAIINELRWGETPKAVLHFKSPVPTPLPTSLAADVVNHVAAHRGADVPPLAIRVEDLERYVVIADPGRDQRASIAETPFDRVELEWPLDLLQNSVEIIDSPGLNEHQSRSKVTMDYLGKVDAVVFVMSVHALAGMTEINVIDQDLRCSGHDHLFFVCNRFDELKRAGDRERVIQYAYENLAPRTALGREGVFFVSALDAVIGREENDPQLIERSRIPELEHALARFLVEHRGRIKLLQPAFQLMQGLKAAVSQVLPGRRAMLEEDLGRLEAKVRDAMPQLRDAERRKEATIDRLERSRTRLRDAVRDSAASFLRTLAEDVPTWASSVELENKINVFKFWALKEQIAGVAEEVVAGIEPMIEEATKTWREGRLTAIVEDHLADFSSDAREALSDFLVEMEAIRRNLAGSSLKSHTDSQAGNVERLLAGIGGLMLGGPGSAVEGVTMGYQGMLRSLVPAILVVAGGILVLHLNPITIVPALLATGVFRSWRQGDALTAKAKAEVGKGVRDVILASIAEQSSEIAERIHEQTEPFLRELAASMDREITTVRQQVDAVLETKRLGESEIAAERARVADVECRVHEIDAVTTRFVQALSAGDAGSPGR